MARKNGFRILLLITSILSLVILSSCQGGFSLFATATPTPTLTPTPTFTPSPTPTATNTPTPTPLPTGVDIQVLSDETNLFVDYDNKYKLVLTNEWVILPLDKDDLNDMLAELGKQNPDLAKSAEAFKDMDANVVRMVALNDNPDYLAHGFASNINITALDNPVLSSMPLPFVTGALEESFKQQGMKVLTTGVNSIDNVHGVEIEYIDIEQSLQGIKIQQRLIIFQANKKLIMLAVSTSPQFKDEIFKVAEAMGTSIEFLK